MEDKLYLDRPILQLSYSKTNFFIHFFMIITFTNALFMQDESFYISI